MPAPSRKHAVHGFGSARGIGFRHAGCTEPARDGCRVRCPLGRATACQAFQHGVQQFALRDSTLIEHSIGGAVRLRDGATDTHRDRKRRPEIVIRDDLGFSSKDIRIGSGLNHRRG